MVEEQSSQPQTEGVDQQNKLAKLGQALESQASQGAQQSPEKIQRDAESEQTPATQPKEEDGKANAEED